MPYKISRQISKSKRKPQIENLRISCPTPFTCKSCPQAEARKGQTAIIDQRRNTLLGFEEGKSYIDFRTFSATSNQRDDFPGLEIHVSSGRNGPPEFVASPLIQGKIYSPYLDHFPYPCSELDLRSDKDTQLLRNSIRNLRVLGIIKGERAEENNYADGKFKNYRFRDHQMAVPNERMVENRCYVAEFVTKEGNTDDVYLFEVLIGPGNNYLRVNLFKRIVALSSSGSN